MTVTPPFDPAVQPSAEWDMITLKWLGRIFTGGTTGGELTLSIDRKQPMLYDDPTNPVTILPAPIKAPLTTITLVDGGESRQYMYVAVNVPASDDPDIVGTGFTYTASIKLANGAVYGPFTFTVPHDTPGGVMWLNKVISATPAPGEALPQITKFAFDAAVARIAALEAGAGSGPQEVTQAELDAVILRVVAVETTPPNHAGRHAAGGGDAVVLSAGQVTSGTVAAARLGSGTADGSTVLYGDASWKAAPSSNDPNAVKLTGDQTITGVKTFTGTPVVQGSTWSIGNTAGLQSALDGKAPTAGPSFTGTVTGVTKAMVGLGNVDNTSDASQTVTAAQVTSGVLGTARLGTGTADVTRVLFGDGTWKTAPSGGGTGDDPAAVKLTGAQTVDGVKTFTSAPVVPNGSFTIAKTTGLQGALDDKAPSANPTFSGTVTGLTKAAVGLGNVDNTADSAKTIAGSQVATGTVAAARLGSGTTSASTSLYGDGTWKTAPTTSDPDAVKLTGAQTVAGIKTFSSAPVVPDGSLSIGKTTGLQGALDGKAPTANPTFTGAVTGVTKTHVGLGNVDNVADSAQVIAASQITTGVIAVGRLGTGTTDGTVVLYGDGTWKTAPSGGGTGDDPAAVKLTGAQTIDGVKTFTSSPAVPDSSFAQTKITGLATSLSALAPLASPTFTGTVTGVTKAMVGLSNVDNVADSAQTIAATQITTGTIDNARLGSGTAAAGTYIDGGTGAWTGLPAANDTNAVKLTGNQTIAGTKTFSAAPVVPDASLTIAKTTGLQAGLDAKAPTASPTFTGTVTGVTAAHVGLGNVDNTADTAKTFAATQITTATVPTARLGTGTASATTVLFGNGTWAVPADTTAVKLTGTQTVAGVKTFSSAPVVPTGSWTIASTTGLQAGLDAKAPLASPTFTGTVAGVTKTHVGLANVDNTADTAKTFAATQITTGTIPNARLGTGTAAAGKYVDGAAGAWTTLPPAGEVPSAWTPGRYRTGYAKATGSNGAQYRKRGDLVEVTCGKSTNTSGSSLAEYTYICEPPATNGPWAPLDGNVTVWPVQVQSDGSIAFTEALANGATGPTGSASTLFTYTWRYS